MMRSKLLTWSFRSLMILVLLVSAVGAILTNVQEVSADSVDLYWVGGTGNWTDTARWSTSSGGAGGHAIPTSSNNVFFNNASFSGTGQTVTISSSTPVCKNMDWTGSGAKAPIFSNLSGSGSASDISIYGNLTLVSGVVIQLQSGSYPWYNEDLISFHANGTLTTPFQLPSVRVESGVTLTLAQNTTVFSFISAGGTLANAGFTLYCTNSFDGGGGSFVDTITMTGAYSDNVFTINGANTFTNLTIANTTKHNTWSFNANNTISGIFTLTGASATNRIEICSSSTSVQRTITAAAVVSSHADFMNIVAAGAADWDLSSAGEDSIDFTGNSGITFTYPYSSSRNYYWTGLDDGIAGAGAWDQNNNSGNGYNWSTTSGGAGGAARLPVPGSGNNVYFDANSGFTVGNTDIFFGGNGIPCKDMDFTGANAVAAPRFYPANGGGTDLFKVYGSLTLCSGITWDTAFGYTSNAFILSGSGTVTTNGVEFSCGPVVINSTGTYTLQDPLYCGRGFTYTAGTLNTNGQYIYMTINTGHTFAGGGKTYFGLSDSTSGTLTITGSNNFTNLVRSGTASYTDTIKFAADQYITNLYLHGYNNYQRLQFQSTVTGTSRQCSVSGIVDVENTDLSDSAKVGAGDPDISAGNNSDFGGNLGWIFDTGFYIYWVGNTGNWSDNTNHWSSSSGGAPGTGRVPLVQDIAVFDDKSFTIPGRVVTIDITNLSGIDASTVTNTPTITKSGTVDIYGDVNLGTLAWTVTTTNFKGLDTTLESDSTLTTAFYVLKNAGFMSSLVLNSNITVSGTVYPQSGVFNHNGFSLTATAYDSSTTTYDRQIVLGSGTVNLNGTGAITKWNMNATKLTFAAGESTIIMTSSAANAQTFAGASLVYNNLTVAGAGNYTLTFSGTNTFGTLTIDRSAANKTIAGAITMTITDSGGLVLATAGTNTIGINGPDFTMASGVVFGDYLVITNSAAGGGATYFANVGGHSTNGGGNSGWIWTPPTPPTIQTNNASDVTYLGERLNGELLTTGSYVVFYLYFEYGPTTAYGFTTPETTKTGIGTFSQYLSPYKVYHYRAVVRFGLNDHAYGDDKTVSISGAVGQAKAAVSDPGQSAGTAIIGAGDVPAQPNRMYTEGNTQGLGILGKDAIDPALTASGTPKEAFWFPIAFLIAIVLGFGAFGMTRSLPFMCIVAACVMAAFAGGGTLGDGLLPYWPVIFFLIVGVLLWLIQEKQNI